MDLFLSNLRKIISGAQDTLMQNREPQNEKKSNPSTAVETNSVGSTRMAGFIEARHF